MKNATMPRLAGLAALLVVAAACGPSREPEPTSPPSDTTTATGGAEQPVRTPEPAGEGTSPSPTPADSGETVRYDRTIEDVLSRISPAAQPERRVMALLRAGQNRSVGLELAAGRCYVIVGEVSLLDPPARGAAPDLDLTLLDPAGVVLQQDRSDDSNPVLGAPDAPICPAATAEYTVRAAMERGEGFMAWQAFSSPR